MAAPQTVGRELRSWFDVCQYRWVSKSLPLVEEVACCAPLGIEPMSAPQADRIAGLMKALADPVRLRLMSLIAAVDEVCVCDLLASFDLSQPTISHHLKVL